MNFTAAAKKTVDIQLSKGLTSTVSQEDADLAVFKWHSSSDGYAVRNISLPDGRHTNEKIHRLILSRVIGRPLLRSEEVDHINNDKSDNRRDNLRLASCADNQANKGRKATNTSGYIGVSWNKKASAWRAQIRINGPKKFLGRYASILDAVFAHDKAVIKLRGEFAVTNYPAAAYGLAEWPANDNDKALQKAGLI